MKLLFVSDSFKGSLTSAETAELLTEAAELVFGDCHCIAVPVADGGEGTADAVVKACGGAKRQISVHGPLMERVSAEYGVLDARRAVLEMAVASGLPLLSPEQRNPMLTTSYGTGELIRDALERGFDELTVAIGGSATNDGGMGCMRALGVRFLDDAGSELNGVGADLERVRHIDVSGMLPQAKAAKFVVMCDVDNPLCGENGATYTFGPQKGATPEMLERLEQGMRNYRDVLTREFGVFPDQIPGAGAAGGLGAALSVFLHAELKPGIETMLDLIGFDRLLDGVDLVVTGEGRTDWQSCFGKVVYGVGKRCRERGVPAVVLSGSMGPGAMRLLDCGIDSIVTTVNAPMTLEEALIHAKDDYRDAAIRMFRLIKAGMEICP